MLSISIAFLTFICIVPTLFNSQTFVSLRLYFISVILAFSFVLINLWQQSFVLCYFSLFIVLVTVLFVKHFYLIKQQQGRQLLQELMKYIYRLLLFSCACAYISLIHVPVFTGLFIWFSLIAISTLTTFALYLCFSSAFGRMTNHCTFDGIIVLGAGIFTEAVTPLLASRLNRALSIYNQQSHCTIIVSGGQGKDEPISEALAMKRYLLSHGVPEQSIIMEAHSTNTAENFLYSKSIIDAMTPKPNKLLVVTSQFHILRALRFAQKFGLPVQGIGSSTPCHLLARSLIRDFLGLMHQYKLLLTLYFALLFISAILLNL
ncbi:MULTISPECIES: YdcF family protein [Staphylococcus]|uniref:YdcF family protein n=1 Tax=Staphylococcus lugdunensis TaxID=28035 RepID=A0ABX6BR83_STALU|nr:MULTISPECIES: YdcF family protein [Staphylococcus]ADC86829.1 membrane protein [Staphylococcus lugdunensis HKU09-01]ARJ08565.1 hypothetical protein B7454_03915 [Staphylococcus lugdunensis]ARJ15645.1 hypothetical protein B6N54_03155 [Staphylococcus lugdunensis]ARJ29036.1 hypothetical protein B6N84_03185 [Staphylococcus lugdunensis]EKS23640.1 hypothetical protein HMPREF9308_01324 [Staphylococcus lugdunensis ACS-027-V-Sch2]